VKLALGFRLGRMRPSFAFADFGILWQRELDHQILE
jgi:hypothetical protein